MQLQSIQTQLQIQRLQIIWLKTDYSQLMTSLELELGWLQLIMFQNSLTTRIPLRCGEHPKNIITHFCTEARCEGWPLFCEECMASYRFKQKHYGHELSIHEIGKGIEELCGRMERDKKTLSNIYRQIIGMKGAEGLLKWQQEKEQHFMSIEKHISTIKFQVEEQLAGIVQRFQQQLNQEKQKLYVQLENYYANYREKFDKFSRLTEPIVAISNKFKFYASTSAVFFKISSQAGTPKLALWLNQLKRTLSQSEKASAYPGEYIQQIRKYGDAANSIMDDLPRIRNEDFEKQMPGIANASVREILRSLVRVRDDKPVTAVMRSNSMDSMPAETSSRKPAVIYK